MNVLSMFAMISELCFIVKIIVCAVFQSNTHCFVGRTAVGAAYTICRSFIQAEVMEQSGLVGFPVRNRYHVVKKEILKAKKKPGKGELLCRGCSKHYGIAGFPTNGQNLHVPCERRRDSL